MLVEYAKNELQIAGLLDKDSDYEGRLGESVLELIEVFAKQGHSGGSREMMIGIFTKLAMFHPLTPITSNPDEWMKVSETGPMWQSKRKPTTFSKDGGKTWYDLDENQ